MKKYREYKEYIIEYIIYTIVCHHHHRLHKKSSSLLPEDDLYSKTVLTTKVVVPFILVGSNVETTIKNTISAKFEGKCIVEGFVKPGSISIIKFSSGTLTSKYVEFEVVFECNICCPVEGMQINCLR